MRKAFVTMVLAVLAYSAQAQQVTIKINGNKTRQVMVDGKAYTPGRQTGTERTIGITNLAAGQHSIQVVRNNSTSNNTPVTTFTTIDGYETVITIAANGSVHLKNIARGKTAVKTPMTDAAFTTALQRVRNHFRNTSRHKAALQLVQRPDTYLNTSQVQMLLESFDGELGRLEVARAAFPNITDPVNFASLSNMFTIQSNKDELASIARSAGGDLVYSYSESFRSPVTTAGFDAIIDRIESQWQEGARLSTIIDVIDDNRNYFTTNQALELVQLVSDQSSRLHLVKAIYSRLTDPQNVSLLYTLFYDENVITQLKNYLNANDNSSRPHNFGKTSITDAAFSKIYDEARSHFRSSSRLRSVTAALSDTTLYFTSYQVRQLLLLLKTEAERLELAKAAYRGVTDPANFLQQMKDLFTWEASRTDLENYIGNYTKP